jgi:DUF4097 and DUF4098 domain-containing protein YvlB
MSEEKVKILKQVEEGKLSVEEALKLIEELDGRERGEQWSEGLGDLRAAMSEVLNEVGDSLKEAGETVNEVMNEVGKELRQNQDVRAAFSGLLSGLISFGGGQLFEFAHTGEFQSEHVRVALNGTNGRLSVRRWQEPGYKLVLKVRVRSSNHESGRARALESYDVLAGEDELTLEIKPGMRHLSVGADLYLPEKHTYDLRLHTSNGSIGVEKIEGNGFAADTSNGSVRLDDCWFADARVDTSNGAVSLTGICGNAHVRTSNGSIRVESGGTEDSRLDLATSNGSITLVINESQDMGYHIDASTSNGRVNADVDGLSIRTSGRNQLQARSQDFESKSRRMHISARTSNGRINIVNR